MVRADIDYCYANSIKVAANILTRSPDYVGTHSDYCKTSFSTNNTTCLSNGGSSAISNVPTSGPTALWSAQDITQCMEIGQSSNAIGPVPRVRFDFLPKFIAAYHTFRNLLATRAELIRTTVIGSASTYNPYRDENGSHEIQTASGELYDPTAWTAAIQINLREQFGGIRYGKNYQPTYALVESREKQVIVKINDVGPLKPGRVIDLTERSMSYFDPSLQLGLISDVKITLLPGEDWTPGPIGGDQLVCFAFAQYPLCQLDQRLQWVKSGRDAL
jgi:rare lipoprotein A